MLPPGTPPVGRSGFSIDRPLDSKQHRLAQVSRDSHSGTFSLLQQTSFPPLCFRFHRRHRHLQHCSHHRPDLQYCQTDLHHSCYHFSHQQCAKNIQNKANYLEEDEPDQSPIRPTLGFSAGRDQLEGRGSAASPPRLRPPPDVLLLSSDIEVCESDGLWM